MALKLSKIHHTAIIVSNLDRSIYFYHDLLGLPFSNEPSPWFEGPELSKGVNVPDAKLRQVSLSVGDHSTLELIEYANRPEGNDTPIQQNYLGAMHMAFEVENVEEAFAELTAKGIEFYSEPNVVDEGVLAGWRWVYFHDPDGIPLELVEVAYYEADARAAGIAEYLRTRPALNTLL